MEFDFAKVTEQSKDNPVFYVQYAHARAASVMRHAVEQFASDDLSDSALSEAPLDRLADPAELALIRSSRLAWVVESAAEAHEPHRIAFYLQDVAAMFHPCGIRARTRRPCAFSSRPTRLTRARLALVRGVAIVIASGLAVFGVEPVEEM